MAQQPPIPPLPLEQFFAQLHDAGFKMDTRRKLRLLQLLDRKGAEWVGNVQDLKYGLAPFVASNAEEQRQFYLFFDEFWEKCQLDADHWAENGLKPKAKTPPPNFWKQYDWVLPAIAIVCASIVLLVRFFQPEHRIYKKIEIDSLLPKGRLFEGQAWQFNLTDTTELAPDSVHWEIRHGLDGASQASGKGLHFNWTAAGYQKNVFLLVNAGMRGQDTLPIPVHCGDAPVLTGLQLPKSPLTAGQSYRFSVKPPAKARVFWVFARKDTVWANTAQYQFREAAFGYAKCVAYHDRQDCYTDTLIQFQVGNNLPILPITPLKQPGPPVAYRLIPWYWLSVLLFFGAALLLWLRWRKKRREKVPVRALEDLEQDYPIHDRAPYFVPYLPQERKIKTPPDFFRMADVLRRRVEMEHRELDVPASVRATADAGGFLVLSEKRQTSPSRYLFLVERTTEQDQAGRLYERLARFFKSQDAPIELYFHNGDFLRFWNEQHVISTITQLHQHYADCRLVCIGAGQGLMEMNGTALNAGILADLMQWKRRLLLTPQPVSGWYAREVLLQRHFQLFPADTEGILDGLNALDENEDYEPEPWTTLERRLGDRRTALDPRTRLWETPEQHRAFLQDDACFKWLCGLAVSVQPDFALTVAIGAYMGIPVTHDRLLLLTRIPWLAENTPDDPLRLGLLACLSEDEERSARLAATAELEAVQEQVHNGFAELEWKSSLAIHRFALEPNNESHREVLKDLARLGLLNGSQYAELDGIVQRRIDANATFESLIEKPTPKPFFTPLFWWICLCTLLGAAALWYGVAAARNTAQADVFKKQVEMTTDSAYIRHLEAVRLGNDLGSERQYPFWQGRQFYAEVADSLLKRAAGWSVDFLQAAKNSGTEHQADPPFALADSNRMQLRYNTAAQQLNFYLRGAAPDTTLRATRDAFWRLYNNGNANRSLTLQADALHGYGLSQYYLSRNKNPNGDIAMALSAYRTLLTLTDSLYFDTLSLPANLQTLLEAEGLLPARTREPFECRRIINVDYSIGMRNRPLSQPEFNEVYQKRGGTLDRATLMQDVPAGSTVDLLDSNALCYKIRYRQKTGYIARFYRNKPVLGPCVSNTKPPDVLAVLAEIERNMIPIQGGTFTMGCTAEQGDDCYDSEKPAHQVIVRDFALAKTEVTIGQYLAFCDETKTHYPEWLEAGNEYNIVTGTNDYYKKIGMARSNPNNPVTGVSWDDAVAYCAWLTRKTGRDYRLPTEAEWEFAARGGTQQKQATKYAGSDDLDAVGWFTENTKDSGVRAVATKKANVLGLYDMSGNVYEWCSDWFGDYSIDNGKPMLDQGGPTTGADRVFRGGSWNFSAGICRVSYRNYFAPDYRYYSFGFRLCSSPQ